MSASPTRQRFGAPGAPREARPVANTSPEVYTEELSVCALAPWHKARLASSPSRLVVDLPHLWMGLFAVGREVSEFDLEALRTIETSTRVRSRRALAAAVMVSTGIWALAASFVSFGGMAHGLRAIWVAASLPGLASLVLGVILAANASVDVLTVADEQGASVRIEVNPRGRHGLHLFKGELLRHVRVHGASRRGGAPMWCVKRRRGVGGWVGGRRGC
ncbi:hypothetical protein QP879_10580, partial [Actinomyces urogenitalis]|uniref:hypothetical protein n=1 Tax=Actinomyces urogenitalis TaxID=103621 RepID=UPI00254B9325